MFFLIKHYLIIFLLFCSQFCFAELPLTIKFSHVAAADSPKGKAALFFKQRLESLSQNQLQVQVYPNSTLFKDREELEALKEGKVQIIAPALAKFSILGVKEFELFDLPYLFKNYDEVHQITDGKVGQLLFNKLSQYQMRGLAYWDNGFKSFSSWAKIVQPSDLQGLKIRIQPSKVLEAQIRALNATPLIMPFSDVYNALREHLVDATENPSSNFYTQNMQQVQPYLTLTEHGYLGYAVITSESFWKRLSVEQQAIFTKAMYDATHYANQIAKNENEDALNNIRQSNLTQIYTPSPIELQRFKEILLQVHKEKQNRIGKELLDLVYQTLQFKADF